MEEFLHVSLGNLLTIATFLVGSGGLIYSLRSDLRTATNRLKDVEKELYELRKVVVMLARQEERLHALDQRMTAQGMRLDEAQKDLREIIRRQGAP